MKNYYLWLIFFLLGLIAVKTIHNPDFFWHIMVGEDIIAQRAVPLYDSFSYHEGLRFFAHEWLFDVIISGVNTWIGIYGVLLLMQLVGITTALMVYKNLELHLEDASFILFMCFCISGPFIAMTLVPRPQMLSSLLALIVLYLFERWLCNEDTSPTDSKGWLIRYSILVGISIFWVNIHGGSYPLLIILLAGYGLEALTDYSNSKETVDLHKVLRVISLGACAMLAFSINPYGFRMLLFPVLLTGDPTTYFISEWKGPVFHGLLGLARYLVYAIPPIVLIASKKTISTRTKFFVFIFTFMGLSSIRHTGLLILFNYMYVAEHFYSIVMMAWKNIVQLLSKVFRKRAVTATVLIVLTSIVGYSTWSNIEPIAWEEYPQQAIEYIEGQNIDIDNNILLNNYNWGGYMIFNGFTVFIDGRADVYQEKINPQSQVMKDYLDIIQLHDVERKLGKYDVKYVLHMYDSPLASYLIVHPGWTVLFKSEEENSILLMNTDLN